MQLWLATAHMTAAVVASAIATTHALAVLYHLNRMRGDEEAEQLPVDMTYLQAIRHRAGRADTE